MSSVPTPIADKKKTALADVETNNLVKHFAIHSNGLYGDHQYADLSIILKRRG